MQTRHFFLAGCGLLLAACSQMEDGPLVEIDRGYPVPVGETPRRVVERPRREAVQSRTTVRGVEEQPARPTAAPVSIPPAPPTPAPTPAATPAPKKEDKVEHPFATPVPGKPGFVTSPYAPYAGQVDVQGLAPGSEARDPYTGKIFRVP